MCCLWICGGWDQDTGVWWHGGVRQVQVRRGGVRTWWSMASTDEGEAWWSMPSTGRGAWWSTASTSEGGGMAGMVEYNRCMVAEEWEGGLEGRCR